MKALFSQRFHCNIVFCVNIFLRALVMLIAVSFLWTVNIFLLSSGHITFSKSTPCFTDGDCPSVMDVCKYGSWKGLGKCHRKSTDEIYKRQANIVQRANDRQIFTSRHLIRHKRNQPIIWPRYNTIEERWKKKPFQTEANTNIGNAFLSSVPTFKQNTFLDDVIMDLLTRRKSLVTFNNVNLTVTIRPTDGGDSDWLLFVLQESKNASPRLVESHLEKRHVIPNAISTGDSHLHYQKRMLSSSEPAVADSLVDTGPTVNISFHYPIYISAKHNFVNDQGSRLRFRRQLSLRSSGIGVVDPLINAVTSVEPVIPAAEEIIIKSINKRALLKDKLSQKSRRQFEEIDDVEALLLPDIVYEDDEGPPIIEELYSVTRLDPTQTTRKRRHNESPDVDNAFEYVKGMGNYQQRAKEKRGFSRGTKTNNFRNGLQQKISRQFHDSPILQRLRKRKHKYSRQLFHNELDRYSNIPQLDGAPAGTNIVDDISLLRSLHRKTPKRHLYPRQPKYNANRSRRKIQKTKRGHAEKKVSKNNYNRNRRHNVAILKRKSKNKLKTERDVGASNVEVENFTTKPIDKQLIKYVTSRWDNEKRNKNITSTEVPDTFADLEKLSQQSIDYYDTSKRELNIDDELDPEEFMQTLPYQEKMPISALQENDRIKRQTISEELEDENDTNIPSWKKTIDMLKRANAFAEPAHANDGHVILVRRVRDLGALSLMDSLSKLRETMAKIFGRCAPVKRRKRSKPQEMTVTDELENEETWEIQGGKKENMDKAKISLNMDEDKPYNVTTVLRPMGKRSSSFNGQSVQNKYKHGQTNKLRGLSNSRLIRHLIQNNKLFNKAKDLTYSEKELESPMTSSQILKRKPFTKNRKRHQSRLPVKDPRQPFSKREDYNIPTNKNIKYNIPSDSSIGFQLSPDQSFDQSVPFVSSKLFSDKEAKVSVKKSVSRNRHREARDGANVQVHSRNNVVRDPYRITRRYNASNMRSENAYTNSRPTRELDQTSGNDRASLLYIANDGTLPVGRSVTNFKRDLEVSAEVEDDNYTHTTDIVTTEQDSTSVIASTTFSPKYNDAEILPDDHNDVFAKGNAQKAMHAGIVVVASDKFANKLDDLSLSNPSNRELIDISDILPISEEKTSSFAITDGENVKKSEVTDETFMSDGGLDERFSDTSNRLVELISGIEKALRVPLKSSDIPSQITVVEENNLPGQRLPPVVTDARVNEPNLFQINVITDKKTVNAPAEKNINNEPSILARKKSTLSETYPLQPPLPLSAAVKKLTLLPQHSRLPLNTWYAYPRSKSISKVNENIYLKGVNPTQIISRPLFVDSVANKMAWVEPSYSTIVSAETSKIDAPVIDRDRDFLESSDRGIAALKTSDIPILQVEKIESIPFVSSHIEIDKNEPFLSGVMTNVDSSRQLASLPSTGLINVQKVLQVDGQAVPAHSEDKDTTIQVLSSFQSDDSNFSNTASPKFAVKLEGINNPMIDKGASNIRIFKLPGGQGHVVASIGTANGNIQKKEVDDTNIEIGEIPGIPMTHYSALTSGGNVISPSTLAGTIDRETRFPIKADTTVLDKLDTKNIYAAIPSHVKESWKRMSRSKNTALPNRSIKQNAVKKYSHKPSTRMAPTPNITFYSHDPGVKGATETMLKSLASKLALQNSRQNRSCQSNCLKKRQYVVDKTRVITEPIHTYDENLLANWDKTPKQKNVLTKRFSKRDLSLPIFQKTKEYFSSPKIMFQAPGSHYPLSDLQQRGGRLNNINVSTETEVTNLKKEVLSVLKAPNMRAKESTPIDNFVNLPETHERALKQAARKNMIKTISSDEAFSNLKPSFKQKITSGGDISLEHQNPVFPKMKQRNITVQLKQHIVENNIGTLVAPRNRHIIRAKYTGKKSDYPHLGSSLRFRNKLHKINHHNRLVSLYQTQNADVMPTLSDFQLPDRSLVTSLRTKRRSFNAAQAHRASRGTNADDLRSELEHLNSIGSKMGLRLLNKDAIDKIVKEESQRNNPKKVKRKAAKRRQQKTLKQEHKRKEKYKKAVTNKGINHKKRNLHNKNFKKKNASAKRKTFDVINSDRAMDSGFSMPKRKIKTKQKRRGHRKKISKRHRRRLVLPTSMKIPRSITLPQIEQQIVSGPSYSIQSNIENERYLKFPNPEHHDISNNRLRDETVRVTSNADEPMELNAVLRGKRKKRELQTKRNIESPYGAHMVFGFPAATRVIPDAEPIYAVPTISIPSFQTKIRPREETNIWRPNNAVPLTNTPIDKPVLNKFASQLHLNSLRAAAPSRLKEQLHDHEADTRSIDEISGRQRLLSTLNSRHFPSVAVNTPYNDFEQTAKRISERGAKLEQPENLLPSKTFHKISPQPSSGRPVHVTQSEDSSRNRIPDKTVISITTPKTITGESVWKRLGEMFDISSKETVDKVPETTSVPSTTSSPLQEMVPDDKSIQETRPPEQSVLKDVSRANDEDKNKALLKGQSNKSGLRAAIVDRLLQDLRKMSSARGSDMARAESDLIEILHDYQTDLMDDDEQTIIGEPFHGVRIHDGVAVPVIYQAVPIKLDSFSQHRIIVRSSKPRLPRDHSRYRHIFPFYPP